MRIPFDSICLACTVSEMSDWVGARMQKWVGIDRYTLAVQMYLRTEGWLIISVDPESARAHLGSRPKAREDAPWVLELRKHLADARLAAVSQRGLDRVLDLELVHGEARWTLTAELMGKHSNLVLRNDQDRCIAAAKWIGPSRSRRPILPGKAYSPPPFEPKPSLLRASEGEDPMGFEGGSPFLKKWLAVAAPGTLPRIQQAVNTGKYEPRAYLEGVYPLPLEGLIGEGRPVSSFGVALDELRRDLQSLELLHRERAVLVGQLNRVLLARETALNELDQATLRAQNAGEWQLSAELLLAYQGTIREGARFADVWDYEGNERHIEIDPDLSAVENAERLFGRAKKAKAHAEEIDEQRERVADEVAALKRTLEAARVSSDLGELRPVREHADSRRWLQRSGENSQKKPEERPFEGHSIRELTSPGGWKVFLGENSAANDYLTVRMARPNDYWFHVRGGPSAHVILQTQNQPERVQKEDLLFAARLAARHSSSKHSNLVSVDYTLKKYVRRPKGAAPGMAAYTHEKTLHVEGGL